MIAAKLLPAQREAARLGISVEDYRIQRAAGKAGRTVEEHRDLLALKAVASAQEKALAAGIRPSVWLAQASQAQKLWMRASELMAEAAERRGMCVEDFVDRANSDDESEVLGRVDAESYPAAGEVQHHGEHTTAERWGKWIGTAAAIALIVHLIVSSG